MDLIQRLGLNPNQDRMISIAGSGGKTTLLYLLARMLRSRGIRVSVTTTAHILPPDAPDLCIISDASDAKTVFTSSGIPVFGHLLENGKLGFAGDEALRELSIYSDMLLIEADGSRQMPIKFPQTHEPAVPAQSDRMIVVSGLSALGKPLAEVCHRSESACAALGILPEQIVTPEIIAELLRAGYGRFSPTVLLNQADTPDLRKSGNRTAVLLREHGIDPVIVTSLRQEERDHADTHQRSR